MSRNSVVPVLLSVFQLCIIASTYGQAEHVPVFIWDKNGTPRPTEFPAASLTSKATFREVLEPLLKTDPLIVVFAERSLSTEDFIDKPNTYTELERLKDKFTYIPNVEDPISVIKDVTGSSLTETSIDEAFKAAQAPKSRLYLIDLMDAKEDENREKMLGRHDKYMAKLWAKFEKEDRNVIAIYTAYHASWEIPIKTHEEVKKTGSRRYTRHLLAEEPATGNTTCYKAEHFVMCLTDSILITTDKNITLSAKEINLTSTSSNNTIEVDLQAKSSDVKLTFQFSKGILGYWAWEELKIVEGENSHSLVKQDVTAPLAFSYHCTNEYLVSKNNSKITISLPGLQMQPFFNGTSNVIAFGDAYDCVGFTSAPIWSGLFVTFILAIIMTMGLTMMMDIKTMDRFDDPKGKTIDHH